MVQWLPSQKAICCTFLFNYCALIFPVVQELPNVCNNWKSHCAWPFHLLCTHTLYLYTKEWTWVNIQKPFQTTDTDLFPLISKMELFVKIIDGFYQILIVSYKSIIDVAGALIFLKIGKRFTYFQTSLTYLNATQMLKIFLILGKKTTNKNMVKSKQHVLI